MSVNGKLGGLFVREIFILHLKLAPKVPHVSVWLLHAARYKNATE